MSTRSHLYPSYGSADRLLSYQRGQYNASAGRPAAIIHREVYKTAWWAG